MVDACPAPQCQPVINRKYFVNINGSAFSNITENTDCSRGLILLTDDAGLIDVNDAGLGAYLSTDDRVKLLPNFEEAAKHWNPVSSTYRDLSCFFRLAIGRGSRPPFIYVGYVDQAGGETLTQGFQEIIKCPLCAWTVAVTMYQADGTTLNADTTELRDLVTFIRTDKDFDIQAPTIEATVIFGDAFETTSQAAVAAAAGVDGSYVLSSYYCDVQRNPDNTPFINPAAPDPDNNPNYPDGSTIPEFRFSNDALLAAAFASSYSATRDATYNWTLFLKPFDFQSPSCATGRFLDETTLGLATPPQAISVSEQQIINATGVNGLTGEFVDGSTRSVSLFINSQNGVTFVEGLRVNRDQFVDTWYKEKAINEALRAEVVDFMGKRQALGLSTKEQRLLASRIALVLQSFVDKGVINPESYPWAENGYDNILVERNGFMVNQKPISALTAAEITQRNGYSLGVCYLINEPQHRVGINVCEIAVDLSQVGA